MTPEEKARQTIDEKLIQSGWAIQNMKELNLSSALGVAVREFPTSTGPVDYALFVDGKPVGVAEAKRDELGESITDVENQSGRYANSKFKWVKTDYIWNCCDFIFVSICHDICSFHIPPFEMRSADLPALRKKLI